MAHVHKFRCPVCGSLVAPSRLNQFYEVEAFIVHGLGKAHGFSFERVEDPTLVELVKQKILRIYRYFFSKLGGAFPKFIGIDLQPPIGLEVKPGVGVEVYVPS
jgi:hypothetical protein